MGNPHIFMMNSGPYGPREGPKWAYLGPHLGPNMAQPEAHLNVRECIFPNMGLPREGPNRPSQGPYLGPLL